jgi:uncharacterized RDD family membrane protein YckC
MSGSNTNSNNQSHQAGVQGNNNSPNIFASKNSNNTFGSIYIGESAGFWLRVTAYIIDFIIIGLVIGICGYIFQHQDVSPTLVLVYIFGPWFYESICTSSSLEGTVGKRLIGLKVLNENGERLTFGSATVRFWVKGVLNTVTLGIISLVCAFRADKKTGYDVLVRSSVYKR